MLARNIIRSMTKIGRVRACCHVAAFSTARSAPVWHRPLRTRRRLRRLPFNPRASASAGWPWMPGLKPQMPEPLTIKKLVPLMDEAGVDRAVIVPPDWPGYRHDYGLEAAKRYPNRFAIMGLIPLKNSRSAALLPTWKSSPGRSVSGSKDGPRKKAGLPVMFLINGRSAQVVRIAERRPSSR